MRFIIEGSVRSVLIVSHIGRKSSQKSPHAIFYNQNIRYKSFAPQRMAFNELNITVKPSETVTVSSAIIWRYNEFGDKLRKP
jgi:hypothetical protein